MKYSVRCRSLARGEEEVVSSNSCEIFGTRDNYLSLNMIMIIQAASQSSHRGAAPALVYPSVPDEEPMVSLDRTMLRYEDIPTY